VAAAAGKGVPLLDRRMVQPVPVDSIPYPRSSKPVVQEPATPNQLP